MKRMTWIVVLLGLALGGMGSIYLLQSQESSRELSQISALYERQSIAQELTLTLEKYRRMSGQFRKLTDTGIAQAKSSLREEIQRSTARLERLDPTTQEREWAAQLNKQVADFMVLSAKLEPTLYLKDVYLKPEAQSAHESMLKTLRELKISAEDRQSAIREQAQARRSKLVRALAAVGGFALVMLALFPLNVFSTYVRPIRKLMQRVREVREGKLKGEQRSRLAGIHAEIEQSINDLAFVVDAQRRERQNFVTAVASDLRVPVIPLQTSAQLLASVGDKLEPGQRADAAEVVRRSVVRLSRTLEDLTDTLSLESGNIKLEEKIVDLRELLSSACAVLTGPGSSHDLRASLPATPVFALLDPARVERVLLNLISKIMQYSPQGCQIEVELVRSTRAGQPSGLEVLIHEGARLDKGPRAKFAETGGFRASGPEQDLVRHWISENGFGMALAQKIIEAHGGTISAAGVAGSSVAFTIRLPEGRLANAVQSRSSFSAFLTDTPGLNHSQVHESSRTTARRDGA